MPKMEEEILRSIFYCNCRNCHAEIKSSAYGNKKRCPVCGEYTVVKNIKDVHVLFDISHEVLLSTKGEYERDLDFQVFSLAMPMDMGDISRPPYSNAKEISVHSCYNIKKLVREIANTKRKIRALPEDTNVYLWDWEDASGRLCLRYFAKEFLRFDNVYRVKYSPGVSGKEALSSAKAFSKEDLCALYAEYQAAASQGGYYYVPEGETVRAVAETHYDEIFLSFARPYFDSRRNIEGKVLEMIGLKLSVGQTEHVLYRLAQKGNLVFQHPFALVDSRDWQNDFLKVKLNANPQVKFSSGRIFSFLCEAFIAGGTTDVYRHIDEDCSFSSSLSGVKFRGREKVCAHLEITRKALNDAYLVDCYSYSPRKGGGEASFSCISAEKKEATFFLVSAKIEHGKIAVITVTQESEDTNATPIAKDLLY